jgi:hypothetical protein
MPTTYHTSSAESIYDEYAAVATVPLTIDWGTKNKGQQGYEEKQLPLPPIITDSTSFPKIIGRRGFGANRPRSSSPLSREWSDSEDSNHLVRRSAMRKRNMRESTESVESVWFAPVGFDVRSRSTSPQSKFERRESSVYESPSTRDSSILGGSVDTWASSAQSRIRILDHENSATPTEIYVGALYEIVSYVWDTLSHPQNINTFESIFSEYTLPRLNVINLVTSSSMSLDAFLHSTELQVHINPIQKPRYTSLETLEITLPTDLVDALSIATPRDQMQIKGILRIAMIQEIGEYILNHVLLYDGMDVLISPSIDLKRVKEMKGREVTALAIFGGISSYRWRSGRIQVLFRKEKLVYRVPERVIGEMYRNDLIQPFQTDELDL